MLLDFVKSFLVGICASAPMGPIAILVLQKSISEGHRAGFLTGLGATFVDTMYASLAIFALALAETFIGENQLFILLVGGAVVTGMGCAMTFRDPLRKVRDDADETHSSLTDFLKAVLMGISNPGAILVIFALFAFFGIELETHDFRVAPVILALSAGSALWWFLYSWGFSHLRNSFKLSSLLWINRISGVIVMIIGIALLAEGLMKAVFLPGATG